MLETMVDDVLTNCIHLLFEADNDKNKWVEINGLKFGY